MIHQVSWAPPPETLKTIPIAAIHDYLTRRGWVQMPSTMPQFRYYENPELLTDEGKPLYYFFPASDRTNEYPLNVLHFIEGQSRFQQVHPTVIFQELTGTVPSPATTTVQAVAV